LALPTSTALKSKSELPARNLGNVMPPRSSEFYSQGESKEAEYERLVDEEIKTLFKLSQQNRKSPNRGEIWLRLGERYVEKSRLVEFRAQAEYDKKLKEYLEKKTAIKPQLENKLSREYNQKAVQLYEWFIKDFPNDPKVDQSLFFLGYNQFELGNTQAGEQYYSELLKRYPDSTFVIESHFALGEYYFDNEMWDKAYENYAKVAAANRARLNSFALYKSAWCLYRLNRTPLALKALERVIRLSRASGNSDNGQGRRSVNKIRLASEALKDYVPFYAEVGEPDKAISEFARVANDDKVAFQMLEKLAFIYGDTGNKAAANYLFKKLISIAPESERAAEYQYQVVLAYASSDKKEFHKELAIWLDSFGPQSYWAKQNAGKEKLLADVAKLQETTLRNHVLQLHQTAQNSRAPYTQEAASEAYAQYVKHFPNSPQIVEMQFFHAELLYDMNKYEEAAALYKWVEDKDPKGPYAEKSIINTLLAYEKDLPSAKEIDEKRGNSLEKMPLDPAVERFEKAAQRYIQRFPKGEKVSDIQRRLGVLYYGYNHFEEAVEVFEKVITDNPKSENAEIAGNLILDIYKLKGDMVGLVDRGQQLLANPAIAKSKFGEQIRAMLEKAAYVRAEKLSSSDPLRAAKEFEAYATNYNKSDLVVAARYKAAENFEKGGDFAGALRNYRFVLGAPAANDKIRTAQNDSRNAMPRLYQQTGLLEAAAKQYVAYAEANPKDQKAINGYFNAGVLFEALGMVNEAIRSYQTYMKSTTRADRIEVLFNQGEMLRKAGNEARAFQSYDEYLRSGPRSARNAIAATFWIADHYSKRGQEKPARQWYSRVIEMYKTTASSNRGDSVRFAAEARFELAQETLVQVRAVRFGSSDKQQGMAAAELKRLRDRYINEMAEVIRFDHGPFIVAALASSGQMFQAIAQAFAKAPAPAGYSAQDAAKFRELLQGQINGFNGEAKNSYQAAVDKANDLEVFTPWSAVARAGLASLDPASVSDAQEFPAESRAADWMGL
jgi:tetratricopeptide (TPR) repeat protein